MNKSKNEEIENEEKSERRPFDHSWKKIIDKYFWKFIKFYFKDVYDELEQTEVEFLDTELPKINLKGKTKNRIADKLVGVYTKSKTKIRILIHIEIQGAKDNDFPYRMFQYFYRILDKMYEKDQHYPIVSLALLTDPDLKNNPKVFEISFLEGTTKMKFEYLTHKLYQTSVEDLKKNPNIFSIVSLACIYTNISNSEERLELKKELTMLLEKRGYLQKDVYSLFEFIDAIITLPDIYSQKFSDYIYQNIKEGHMTTLSPFMLSVEKRAKESVIEEYDEILKEKDEELKEKDEELKEKDEELKERDKVIKELFEMIENNETEESETMKNYRAHFLELINKNSKTEKN